MTKLYSIAGCLLLFLGISACSDDPGNLDNPSDFPPGIKEALAFEYLIHDIEGIIFNLFHSLHERDRGAIETHVAFNIFSGRGACASQQLNTDLNRIILNFSDACSGQTDRIRGGILLIDYTDPENKIGNLITITLDQYRLNGLGHIGCPRFGLLLSPTQVDQRRNRSSHDGV